MKIAVFGLGYVGTVTAACLASVGHEVWGVDVDPDKVALVRSGHSTVVEPGLEELVAEGVRTGRLHAVTEAAPALERADLSLLCVGTPSTAKGATDLAYLRRAVDEIARTLPAVSPPASGLHGVVVRSTVPPGTVRDVVTAALADLPAGPQVAAAMCPEFLREGTGVADFFAPPVVVVGTEDDRLAGLLTELLAFLDRPVRVVPSATAESLKYACNAFHATKVSFANEMGRLLRGLGVDAREVMTLLCEDRVLNVSPAYLQPGFAFGGSCLPKDLRSLLHLARTSSTDLPLLAGTLTTNELVVRDVVDRVVASEARRVALLGLSFKSGTDDLRESPNVELAERLLGKGVDVAVYDPVVNPATLVGTNRSYVERKLPHLNRLLAERPEDALAGADLAVVSTRDERALAALRATPPPRLIDQSGRLGAQVEALAGYEGVGW